MPYAINRKELSAQPVLVMRRRVKLYRDRLGRRFAEILPSVFKHAIQQTGAAIAGQPFTRYLEWGPGLVTIEAGIPVVASGNNSHDASPAPDGSEIVADCLPGGPVATVTHSGPYEKLAEAHAAIQQWIEAQGLLAAGPPWETYTTDPADYPDPQDWKTDGRNLLASRPLSKSRELPMDKSQRPPFTAFMIAVGCFNHFVARLKNDRRRRGQFRWRQHAAEQQFDGRFFDAKRDPSVEAAQIRLTRVLKKRIEAIDRSCKLDASQTKKLELAGRTVIKRLFDSIAERKHAFLSEGRNDLAATKYLYESPEILALRKKLRDGPFDEESLFAKTVANILTPQQAARYAKRSALATQSNRKITTANVGDLVRIAEFQKDVYRVAWDRDGKHVGCLEYRNALDVYLPLADQPVRTFGQGANVLGFDFGPDADLLATVDSAGKVTVLSFLDGKKLEIPIGQRQSSVKFSPDGKTLVTAGYGTKAYLWSTATRELIREFALDPGDGGLTPAFSPDGKILAVGNRNLDNWLAS